MNDAASQSRRTFETCVAAGLPRLLAAAVGSRYGKGMARTRKMTFTVDEDTATGIDRTAARLGIPKSAVVREAVAEYAARLGHLSDQERRRVLQLFDDVIARIPRRPAKETDAELAAVRMARRHGGRRTGGQRGQ